MYLRRGGGDVGMSHSEEPEMNAMAENNMVHESETQRQYLRVNVPGRLTIESDEGVPYVCALYDLSNGGISFDIGDRRLVCGRSYKGSIELDFSSLRVAVPVEFRITYIDTEQGRAGAVFERLDSDQIALLRRIVIGFVSGELTGAGELIHTLSRDNYSAARRRSTGPDEPSRWHRLRALGQTALVLAVGLAALIYAANQTSQKLFAVTSSAARVVTGPGIQVKTPRDGLFQALVREGQTVEAGAPIATFRTGLALLIDREALADDLPPEQIEALLSQEVMGTVTSPCDCLVTTIFAVDDQYLNKGERLMTLAPLDASPQVVARFDYGDAGRLSPGVPVRLQITGEDRVRTGRVLRWRSDANPFDLDSDLVVVVSTDRSIPTDLLNRPAKVTLAAPSWIAEQGWYRSALAWASASQ